MAETVAPRKAPPTLHRDYAAAFLGATVLAGVWLRAVLVRPELLAGFTFRNAVHAHSPGSSGATSPGSTGRREGSSAPRWPSSSSPERAPSRPPP